MSDSTARGDDQLPSIRSLTGSHPSKAAAPQQPRESQQQQTQPSMHGNRHFPSYSQDYSHHPRHNDHAYHSTAYSAAQSKHQSPPYSQPYQRPGPSPAPVSYEQRVQSRFPPAQEYPSTHSPLQRPYQRPQQSEGYAYHVSEPTQVESTSPVSRRNPPEHYRAAYGGESQRYEGSHSMPTTHDYYRQPLSQPHQRPQYQSEHPSLIGTRERTLDAAGMTRTRSHYQAQYQPHYTHYSQSTAAHASPPHHQASYERGQEQDRRLQYTSAALRPPEYQQVASPSHYVSYAPPGPQRAAAPSDSVYLAGRGHHHPPPPAIATHPSRQNRQRPISRSPPLSTARPTLSSGSSAIRAPATATSETPLSNTAHCSSAMAQAHIDVTSEPPPLDDDDDDDDDKSDDLDNNGVDEALLKRRKRNAQSAARLRERRKNREHELTGSCTKLESKISRLESELNEEKRRAIAELRGGKSSMHFPQDSRAIGVEVTTNEHGELFASGIKRPHPEEMDIENDLQIGNRSTDNVSKEGSSKKVRPLRELDQVRLDDLKLKIENLGTLNQQVCVNLGVLRQEIQRIAEAILSQKKR